MDKFGPLALSATAIHDPTVTNRIEIIFDEPLLSSTVHSPSFPVVLANGTFRVVMLESNRTVGVAASRYLFPYTGGGNKSKVTLTMDSTHWHYRSNYFILLNNIRDARTNVIAPNSIFPVAWPGGPVSPLPPSADPDLTITQVGTNGVRISWPTNAYSYALDWTTNIMALETNDSMTLWCEEQPGMANPFFRTNLTGGPRFYRLRKTQ